MMSYNTIKKNILVMCLLILGTLMIAGCTGGSGGDGVRAAGIGGSSGNNNGAVVIDFVENNPPSQMFKGESYDFAFMISNYQMHEIDDLRLRITGFDRGNVRGLPEEDTVASISAATEFAGAGVMTNHFYEGVVVDNFIREFPLNPRIRYCYTQTSFRQQSVCVPDSRGVCDRSVVVDSGVETNGPFGFTVQQVNAIGDRIRIEFHLSNRLGGRVVDECFGREGFASEYSNVQARLGGEVGQCSPAGSPEFLFANGRGSFICEFPRTSQDSYPAQLTVQASSLYEQETRLNILVRDLNYGISS